MDAGGILLTDLYQLTMLQAYWTRGMVGTAVFEFFVRKLPLGRNFLVAAGLEQALDYLEQARFSKAELDWLAGCGRFRREFVDSLAQWRFAGDVDALPEGTICFADEPLLRVVAPLPQAQLVESRLINLLQFQTMVASKAARCTLAAEGRMLVDFGLRRAHGAEAGLLSARAAYVAGFTGTATVLAGLRWDIPLFGTMAHSYVQAHERETDAFEHFARCHPGGTTLLIDTYDTEAAAQDVVALARRLRADGIPIQAVRLDSGDLADHARRVRAILDGGGMQEVRIFASGNLDEYRLRDLVRGGAPIDGFGVGTRMNTSADHPYLDCAYKLEEYDSLPRRKRSEGKATWPGRKQVWRRLDASGHPDGDTLGLEGGEGTGEPLLRPVMRAGRRIGPSPALSVVREHAAAELARLPETLRALDPAPRPYAVEVSAALQDMAHAVDASHVLQRSPR
ncbi:MAG: nicotinate phosphoribosyltransferase [Betaproteobacteria bacterium]|nr:nicotinate phosphoribosyltransferase [Betaproteobacteria bacterium]